MFKEFKKKMLAKKNLKQKVNIGVQQNKTTILDEQNNLTELN